jgi:anti-sigma B factor antagonist
MKVSPSTYYRYKRRLQELGERGLKNKELRKEHDIKRVSLEQRKQILNILVQNPQYGAKRISNEFNRDKHKDDQLSPSLIYDELKRMRLNTYEKRLEYLRRNKLITEEEFQTMRISPASRKSMMPVADLPTAPGQEVEPMEVPLPEPAEIAAEGPLLDAEPSLLDIASDELAEGVISLSVQGHLDSSSTAELEHYLESVYEYGYRKLVVNLENVSYISSGGWGIFTGRVKTLREGGGDVVLVGMSREVYDIYELLGFRDILMHFQTVDEALSFLALPSELRKKRFDELVSRRAAEVEPEIPEEYEEEEAEIAASGAQSPWTALGIEAGTVGAEGEVTVLKLDGVVDTVSCVQLRSVLNDLVDRGKSKLVIDMSNVEYVSSSGWGVFSSRIKETRESGGDIKIFGMDREVDNIFHLLGFDVIMRSFSILSEAIDDFQIPIPAALEVEEGTGESIEEPVPVRGRRRLMDVASILNFDVTRPRSDVVVLQVGGAIDASTTEDLENHLGRCVSEKPSRFIVDMSEVIYISSSGWGMIVKYMQKLAEANGRLALSGLSSPIFKIFRDLGFEPLIPYYASTEMAIERMGVTLEEEEPQVVSAADIPIDADEQAEADAEEEESLKIEQISMKPLAAEEPEDEESEDAKIVAIDFSKRKDIREDKDEKIKKMGWAEYGKKLIERNKGRRRRKKK